MKEKVSSETIRYPPPFCSVCLAYQTLAIKTCVRHLLTLGE